MVAYHPFTFLEVQSCPDSDNNQEYQRQEKLQNRHKCTFEYKRLTEDNAPISVDPDSYLPTVCDDERQQAVYECNHKADQSHDAADQTDRNNQTANTRKFDSKCGITRFPVAFQFLFVILMLFVAFGSFLGCLFIQLVSVFLDLFGYRRCNGFFFSFLLLYEICPFHFTAPFFGFIVSNYVLFYFLCLALNADVKSFSVTSEGCLPVLKFPFPAFKSFQILLFIESLRFQVIFKL